MCDSQSESRVPKQMLGDGQAGDFQNTDERLHPYFMLQLIRLITPAQTVDGP